MNILLLCGGASAERTVSLNTGKSVYDALLRLRHTVTILDPAMGSRQHTSPEQYFSPSESNEVSAAAYISAFQLYPLSSFDVAFIALHGQYGEDGLIQSILELSGVPYTGSGVLASALCMDKFRTKEVVKTAGVHSPAGIIVQKKKREAVTIDKYPVVVKPNDQGSTVGLTVVTKEEELENALTTALEYSSGALIEEYIDGRELTCAYVEGETLPALEIVPKHKLYDYECKYGTGLSEYLVPAPVSPEVERTLQEYTKIAFAELGCKGYARADFRLKNDNEVFFLEMNTLPGMTTTSLVPKIMKAAGYSFDALIEKIIYFALK